MPAAYLKLFCMKALLVSYSAYNLWANSLLLQAAELLTEEQKQQPLPGSFPGVYRTFLHLLDAESIWWQRMKLQERIIVPGESFTGSMSELGQAIEKQDRQWNQWVSESPDHMFDHVFQYQNSRREQFKQPIWEMLMHLFNHSTYHRGQLVTMFRELGMVKIPATDFIVWSRKKS
jgi:uncharacterized damage-inducible protein DinB